MDYETEEKHHSVFEGFERPKSNFSPIPHELIKELPRFETLAELKIVLYVLRHTWGYHDDYKRITLDEFENGRKQKDGTRMDNGVGMTKPSIVSGIKKAIEHNFLYAHTDDHDKARVKKYYALTEQGLKDLTPTVKELNTYGKEIEQRTEKDTKENTKEGTADKPLKPAEYLALAMETTLQKADWSNYTKVAKTLNDSDVPCHEFIGYVLFIKKLAAASGAWKVTVNSLITNGRVSEYVTQRDKQSLVSPQSSNGMTHAPDSAAIQRAMAMEMKALKELSNGTK